MDLIYSFDPERFYLGTLCKRGHCWPGTQQSLRRIYKDKNGRTVNQCFGCASTRDHWLLPFIDCAAMGIPSGYRLGKLCKAGHRWNEIDASIKDRFGKCPACEQIRKKEQGSRRPRKTDRRSHPDLRGLPPIERRKLYKRKVRAENIQKGLTSTGKPVKSPARQQAKLRDKESSRLLQTLRSFKPSPSVAQLVYQEQKRYWKENPAARQEHIRQWNQAKWWLEYQTNPELRLYTRQKSKRRKAQMRNSVALQVSANQIRARFAQFNHRCAYCGATGEDLHIEHVIPISKGGPHALGNIIPACQSCNFSKKDHEVESWYRSQPFFSNAKWTKIKRILSWDKASTGQLSLL